MSSLVTSKTSVFDAKIAETAFANNVAMFRGGFIRRAKVDLTGKDLIKLLLGS